MFVADGVAGAAHQERSLHFLRHSYRIARTPSGVGLRADICRGSSRDLQRSYVVTRKKFQFQSRSLDILCGPNRADAPKKAFASLGMTGSRVRGERGTRGELLRLAPLA